MQRFSASRTSPVSAFLPCAWRGCPCCSSGGRYSCLLKISPAAALAVRPPCHRSDCWYHIRAQFPRSSSLLPAVSYSRNAKKSPSCILYNVPSLQKGALSPSFMPIIIVIRFGNSSYSCLPRHFIAYTFLLVRLLVYVFNIEAGK